jgi:pyridine nucleotide-disulfide oxidoreductase family protein
MKNLVLIGGGHSHVIVLKMLGMHPLAGVRITLITDVFDTPYSGMLPGHIAGFYSRDECHINLRAIANFAQAQLYLDRALGLDLINNRVICTHRPPVSFDLLSIDIGSTPNTTSTPGAAEYAIPAKPVAQLLTYWQQITQNAGKNPQKPIKIAIVGGGIGGVELALAMEANLHRIHQGVLEIHLFQRHPQLLPKNHQSMRRQIQTVLKKRHIQLHLKENVTEIEPQNQSSTELQLKCESGFTEEYNHIFWVTQASAPPWLQASGLTTDARGFILVGDTLQSLSHPQVFAAGDIATMVNHPRPKAGVFAVRQGKPLFTNLRRYLQGKPLQPYIPQRQYLSLIGTGDGKAIPSVNFANATRGIFTLPPHQLIWCWKDRIDRRFMSQFSNLIDR